MTKYLGRILTGVAASAIHGFGSVPAPPASQPDGASPPRPARPLAKPTSSDTVLLKIEVNFGR